MDDPLPASDPVHTHASSASVSKGTVCAICQTSIALEEPLTKCPGCQAEYHVDCWTENRGCAVYGCSQVPATEGRAAVEVPVAYWGQEYKPCPVCSAQILAAALRCRKCGTIFKTARPLESDEFSKAVSQEASAPRLRRSIVWLFILCVVPFTAPVAGVVALLWRHSRQEDIRRLSSIYSALALIAVVVGLFQTVAIVVLGALFTLFRA